MTKNKNTAKGIYVKCRDAIDLALSGKSKRERLLYPALAVFFCGIAFLLTGGASPFTDNTVGSPLSDALLCAVGSYTPFVYVGCIIGSIYFKVMTFERMITLTFVFVLRIITSTKALSSASADKMFSEKIPVRLAVSAAMCFAECTMFLAKNGIDSATTQTVLSTLIYTPLLTVIFSVYYAKKCETGLQRFLYEISMLFLYSCLVFSSSKISLIFLNADIFFAVFFTLCLAKHGTLTRAIIYGAILGYISSPAYFAAFAVLGALSSLLFSFGVYSACGIACTCCCVCCILIGGATSLTSVVPETVMACGITSPILRYSFLPPAFPLPTTTALYAESFSENARRILDELSFIGNVKNASEGLRGAVKSINTAYLTFNTEEDECQTVTARVCSALCEKCPMSPICLDTNAAVTKEAIMSLTKKRINQKSTQDIPQYLNAQCIRLPELSSRIDAEIAQAEMSKAKIPSPTLPYSAIAEIISDIGQRAETELVFDSAAEKSVSKVLYTYGIPFGGISVIGSTRKKVCIYGASAEKIEKSLPMISKGLREIFGFSFAEPSFGTDAFAPIIFTPARELQTEVAIATGTKIGEKFCGDTVLTFDDSTDNFYALISDGMGSGVSAGKSSTLTAELIRHLALSGMDTALAVRLAGQTLPELCDECFSTVDLLRLDLVSGQASVIKNHAAASYILRNGSVYCCSANSMPIGIGCEADSEKISFPLKDGDTVIMVSDGVCDGLADRTRLPDLIGIEGNTGANELAKKIIAKASEANGYTDDMSALVIKIKSA